MLTTAKTYNFISLSLIDPRPTGFPSSSSAADPDNYRDGVGGSLSLSLLKHV